MNSPSRHAEISQVACVTLMLNSGMICSKPGARPVMQKLHRPDNHSTDQKAATRLAYGQFYMFTQIGTHPSQREDVPEGHLGRS